MENPLSDYLGQKNFLVKSAQIFAYGYQFTYLRMPCFFTSLLFVLEKIEAKISESRQMVCNEAKQKDMFT